MPDYSCLGAAIKKAMPHEKHPKNLDVYPMFGVPFEAWAWWCGECLELEHQTYAANGGRVGEINV